MDLASGARWIRRQGAFVQHDLRARGARRVQVGGRTTDTRGAMGTLLGAPMGRALLAAISLGLLGYASAARGRSAGSERRGSDVKASAVRASFIVRGLAHGLLALSAAKLALGKPSSGDGEKGRAGDAGGVRAPRRRMDRVGCRNRYRGLRSVPALLRCHGEAERPARHGGDVQRGRPLGDWREPGPHRRARHRLHRHRAARYARSTGARSERSRRSARCALHASGSGRWPFAAIAVGLIAYGGYQLLNARYHRVRVC